MGLPIRCSSICCVATGLATLLATSAVASAGSVYGHLELPPPPDRPPIATRGFLDRTENQLTPLRPVEVTPWLLVVLAPDGPLPAGASPGQVNWELVGDSFERPVIGAQVGAVVEVRNRSTTPRTLVAAGQPKLIEGGPLNPTGVRDFKPAAAGVIQLGDADAPHLHGTVVVLATPYFVSPDGTGKFDFGDVAEGSYKLRVFYRDHWVERTDDAVVVAAKGKLDVTAKIPAGYPGK